MMMKWVSLRSNWRLGLTRFVERMVAAVDEHDFSSTLSRDELKSKRETTGDSISRLVDCLLLFLIVVKSVCFSSICISRTIGVVMVAGVVD